MKPEEIARINALARKAKTPEGLTPAEKEEQGALRRRYIDSYKRSLVSQLDNTYVVEPNGEKHKLQRNENKGD